MRFQISSPKYSHARSTALPWARPLAEWPPELFVKVARGISRNVVRFASDGEGVFAIKEMMEPVAVREYNILRKLEELALPVVEPVALITERDQDVPEEFVERYRREGLKGLLITRYLDHSLPLRTLFSGAASAEQAERLLDALAELLVELHLQGFFWGDCSLSNTLFRRDAGRFAAYLVDAETGAIYPQLSDGQRTHDLMVAEENLAGEFLDLEAGFGLPAGIEPIAMAESLVQRYGDLWRELTDEVVVSSNAQYLLESRIGRLNELGFDVAELEIETIEGGHRIKLKAKVVEAGHHRRLLQSLTGLAVQENQARRLLNDVYQYQAWQCGLEQRHISDEEAAYRWLTEVYQPTLEAIPEDLRGKLPDPEIFHQLLEHRWYLSEKRGGDVMLPEARDSYVESILRPMPEPQLGDSGLARSSEL